MAWHHSVQLSQGFDLAHRCMVCFQCNNGTIARYVTVFIHSWINDSQVYFRMKTIDYNGLRIDFENFRGFYRDLDQLKY